MRIGYVSKTSLGGWQAFGEKASDEGFIHAIFYAKTRSKAVQEVVRWLGDGDPLVTLDQALDALAAKLESVQLPLEAPTANLEEL